MSASSGRREAPRSRRQDGRGPFRAVERAAASILDLPTDERQEAVDNFTEMLDILREWDEAERRKTEPDDTGKDSARA